MDKVTLGRKLRQIRQEKGYTQKTCDLRIDMADVLIGY